MGVSKAKDLFQIKIMIPSPSLEHPVSSQAQNEDLKDINVLCTLKIKIESQYLGYGCTKDHWSYQNQEQMPNPSQEPSASSKTPNEGLKDMDVLCTYKLKRDSQNLDRIFSE